MHPQGQSEGETKIQRFQMSNTASDFWVLGPPHWFLLFYPSPKIREARGGGSYCTSPEIGHC